MSKFGSLIIGDINTPREMALADPFTGLPLVSKTGRKAIIRLYSSDSEKAQAFERQLLDARALSRIKPTAASLETEMFLRISNLTESWNLCDLDGEDLDVECTQANAVEFYKSLVWAYEQALDFSRSRVNFKKV